MAGFIEELSSNDIIFQVVHKGCFTKSETLFFETLCMFKVCIIERITGFESW